MKYSEMMMRDKAANTRKSKIEKMENSLSISMEKSAAEALATEKKKYVQDVVGIPEFDVTLQHISQCTLEKGSQHDKDDITALVNKVQSNGLNYDDLGKLETICDNNFKYLFTLPPDKQSLDATSVWGILLAVCAIVFRISYECLDSATLAFFLTLINFVAIMYTFIDWDIQVLAEVQQWLGNNNLPAQTGGNITTSIAQHMRGITIILGIAVILVLGLSSLFGFFTLGNDIITIISLAVSILSDRIVKLFAQHFEWKVYHNKQGV